MSQRPFISLSDDEGAFDEDAAFDLSTMSAMDYLKRVRSERKQIPAVVTISLNNSESSAADSQTSQPVAEIEYHPQNPTKEFGDLQKTKFEGMQKKIQDMRNDPSMNRKLQISDTPEIDTSDADACVAFCETNEPKLSICLALSQNQLEELLENLSDHFQLQIEEPEFCQQLSNNFWITKWIYAALACLHFPLEPNCTNQIRSIARICIQVRNSLKDRSETPPESVLPFNLIICVIALNFRQLDLLSL